MESILTLRGYFLRHFKLCLESKSQLEAWDKLEDELTELQKQYNIPCKPRYSSYEAFRVCKSRYYQIHRD